MPVRVRAQVGAVLSYVRHARRLELYPEVEARVVLLGDDATFRAELLTMQLQLLMSLETKKIEKNLREDIIPEMMRGVPGMKPGTGAIGCTAALALVTFIYFVYYGCKKHGVIGYIKSLAPAGVMFPMNVFVWVIEVFSLLLRPITLAIRLFCNMFAGHIVMGSFAIMASLFAEPLLQQLTAMNAAMALPSVAWLAILLIIYAVELIVAFVQAYVFTVLAAVYIQIAEAEGH